MTQFGRKAKIRNFNIAIFVQQNILQFEVTMNQIVLLKENQSLGNLRYNAAHFVLCQLTALLL